MTSVRDRLSRIDAGWWTAIALAALLVLIDLWWLHRFREGQPLNIDENGYMSFAWADAHGALDHGLSGLWDAYRIPHPQAPLLGLVTALPLLVFGDHYTIGFGVQLLVFGGLVLVAFGLGRRLGGTAVGLLTAALTATAPGITDYARIYEFAIPATLTYTAAAWALISSDGLRRRGPALAFGALLGLSTLARTMMVAFVPGLVLAALMLVVFPLRDGLGRRMAHLAAALALGFLLAYTWWESAYGNVIHYLDHYGYGAKSHEYGPVHSVFSLDYWTGKLSYAVTNEIYLPLAAILLLGLYLLARAWLRARTMPASWRQWAPGPVSALTVVLLADYLALTSSANQGSGFAAPMIPLAAGLAALGLMTLRDRRRTVLVIVGVVCVVNVVSKADVIGPLSRPQVVKLPLLGNVQALDGRGSIMRLVAESARLKTGPVTSPLGARSRAYRPFSLRVARYLFDYAAARGRLPIVALAPSDPLFNVNSVGAAANFSLGRPLPVAVLDPIADGGDTVAAYRRRLTDPQYGQPNFLITDRRSPAERWLARQPYHAGTLVTQQVAEAAGRSVGFRLVRVVKTPAGNPIRIYWIERGPAIPAPTA